MSQYKTAYIALGANLGDMKSTFHRAIAEISTRIGEVNKVSPFYHSKALNPPGLESQPEFLNAALCCITSLEPKQILDALLNIETGLGRVRSPDSRWGPRTLDLDLIAVDQLVISSPDLKLPHTEMQNRDFVLQPMSDIAPDFIHPLLKLSVRELLDKLPRGDQRFVLKK